MIVKSTKKFRGMIVFYSKPIVNQKIIRTFAAIFKNH